MKVSIVNYARVSFFENLSAVPGDDVIDVTQLSLGPIACRTRSRRRLERNVQTHADRGKLCQGAGKNGDTFRAASHL